MAVPKKKTSNSRRNQRRAHDSLSATTIVENETTGEYTLPHHVTKDGYYKGKQVIIKRELDTDSEEEQSAE
jgi:large subunit ribosomal protein L32